MLDSVAGARRWPLDRPCTAFAAAMAAACLWGKSSSTSAFKPAFEAFAPATHPFRASASSAWRRPWSSWPWPAGARSPAEKQRIGLLAAAFALVVFNQGWFQLTGFLPNQEVVDLIDSGWTLAMDALAGVVAPALFAYAILRHRVLDLGFALNRTLIYSGVSAIMLGAFGLIEWGFDHFVKIHGRGENALIDAAIALGVYLAFHRVTGVVEHVVETLFFHRWREKEAQLRRFVADAAFVTRPDALLSALVGAAGRFADVQGAAVYLAQAGGDYRRAEGAVVGLPDTLDANDPALVRARGEHKPVEPEAVGSRLAAGLVCPMVQRNEVTGLLVLGPRAEGQAFRPDEIELLGWATAQVGLDLHALEIEALQASVTRLEHQLEGARLVGQRA